MTQHELLAVLKSAEEEHRKPESQGGHGGPLPTDCLLANLPDNARELGYPPGYLTSQFRLMIPKFEKKGWLVVTRHCGQDLLSLTPAAIEQLEEWNRYGCEVHMRRSGRKPVRRNCVGETVYMRLRGPEAA